MVPHRTSDIFAYTSKDDGKVTKKTDRVIEVTYKDGSTKSIPLGIRYGVTPDFKIPHPIVTSLKEGDKLKKGDIITYNTNYFAPDPLDKTQVIWMMSTLINTALLESPETLEDSSMLSEKGAKLLGTQMAKSREIVLEFKQAVHELVKEGDWVEVDSPLCIIEDPVTADQGLFDDETMDTLKLIAANNPKAKMAGRIGKVEVFYHGDMDELSPSLQDLAHESDLKRKRLAKELSEKYTSGQVDDSLRVDGKPLLLDHAVIRVTIVADVPMSTGDKAVYASQMKSICSRIMTGTNETVSGEPIDALFSYSSFSDRIATSPDIIGTTNTLLSLISKKAATVYFGK